jgi:hypothetical protein
VEDVGGETIDNEDEVEAFDTLRSRWPAALGPALGAGNGERLRVSRVGTLPKGRQTLDPGRVSISRREEYMESTDGQACLVA